MADHEYWTSVRSGRISRRRALTSLGVTGVGLAGAALIGCGGGGDAPAAKATIVGSGGSIAPAPQATGAAAQPKKGGTFRMARLNDPPTIDPMGNLSADSKSFTGVVYSRLLAYKAGPGLPSINFDTQMDAAQSVEVVDASHYIVKLNPKVKFTAPINRAMTSEDVKFSLDRLTGKTPGSKPGPDAGVVESIQAVTTPDGSTVDFKLKRKYGAFPGAVLADARSGQIMPIETGKAFNPAEGMIGSGPWIFEQYRPGALGSWKRNPDWHLGPDKPYFEKLEQNIIKDNAAQLSQFLGGNLDVIAALAPADIQRAQAAIKEVQVIENPVGNTRYIVFSKEELAGGPVKDARVRRAISMALDRDQMLDAAFDLPELKKLGITPTYHWDTFIPHSHTGYWLDPKKEMSAENAAAFKKNNAEAMKLLDAAGFKDGFSMEWHWTRGYARPYQVHGELISQMLKDIKIDFKTVLDDYSSVFIPQTFVGKFKGAALISYTLGETGNFVEAPFTPGLPRNVSGIDDPDLNKLIKSYSEAASVPERQKLMKDMQELATKTMYYVPIPQAPSYSGAQPNMRGVADYRSQGHASSVEQIPWWWRA
jgi:peptide/nickel transport system substrate-binding protein